MGPSFGNGADGAYLYFCFVQRREIMEVKCSGFAELRSIRRIVFFVGCIGFGYRLGQARTRSTVLCCVVVLKQPRRRRCNSEAAFFDRLVYLNISRFCKTIVVVAVPVCSPVRIACFYLVSVQFNPLPFWSGPARHAKKRE